MQKPDRHNALLAVEEENIFARRIQEDESGLCSQAKNMNVEKSDKYRQGNKGRYIGTRNKCTILVHSFWHLVMFILCELRVRFWRPMLQPRRLRNHSDITSILCKSSGFGPPPHQKSQSTKSYRCFSFS